LFHDGWLESQGLIVLRVPASYVHDNLDGVLRAIEQAAARAAAT